MLVYVLKCSIIKTLILNFRIFPFRTALKLPILFTHGVKTEGITKGTIEIQSEITRFMIKVGLGGSRDLNFVNNRKSYLSLKNAKIIFKGRAVLAQNFNIIVQNSDLTIGENFSCNNGCTISCLNGITFGNDCLLGGDIIIRDSDGHKIHYAHGNSQVTKKISIGNHVWICSKCNILKGFSIGDESVVAYGSLCIKGTDESNVLFGGYPAQIIKKIDGWEK